MKASFFERLIAYIMDMIILSAVVTIVAVAIPNSDTTDLQNQITEITDSYMNQEITVAAYFDELSHLYYQIDTQTMLVTIISVLFSIMYFMYYQFKNDGQTIGKRIMKIKIVKDAGKLELDDLVVRSLLIDGILCSMILLLIIFVTDQSVYFLVKSGVEFLQFIFIVICTFMILSRKDKKGWHDLICKTSVISIREEAKV